MWTGNLGKSQRTVDSGERWKRVVCSGGERSEHRRAKTRHAAELAAPELAL